MHTSILGSARLGTAASVIALATWTSTPASSHAAGTVPARCIVTSSTAATTMLTSLRGRLAITQHLLRGATVGSPADRRLTEETDRLQTDYEVLAQLRTALAAKEGASAASAARWRAKESTDALCEQLQLDP